MKARLFRAILAALALLVALPGFGLAQGAPPPPPAALFSPPQLDQMLAPIALYPDPLLMQILTAATYPLEVSQAAAWVQDPNNARLTGDALTAALANQDWDPSVKSLVPFPQALLMMSSKLDWLQAVGDAFLAQQSDVMDSVQRLRSAAQAAGSLASGPQLTVTSADQAIEIEPANAQMVYMPCYNPGAVYGAWPYADYPPIALAPWSGCNPGPGLGFSVGINIVPWLWGWGSWDWRDHRIHVDASRFDRIDPRREHFSGNTWTFDPAHRRGVAYRDPATRARVAAAPARAPAAAPAREFRGFAAAPAAAPARPVAAAPARPAAAPARPAAAPARPAAAPARPVAAPVRAAAAPRAPAPAFARSEPGAAARAASVRGHASLQPPRPPAAPPRAAPAPRAAPKRAPAGPARPGTPPHP